MKIGVRDKSARATRGIRCLIRTQDGKLMDEEVK